MLVGGVVAAQPAQKEKKKIKPEKHSKLTPDIHYSEDEILVRFKEGVSQKNIQNVHAKFGPQVKSFNYKIVSNLQRVKLPPGLPIKEALKLYRENPKVLYAEPNYVVEAFATPNDPRFNELWGLHNTGQSGGTLDADIDAPEAWNITTGNSDVVVVVIDTGINYTHQDLSSNMWRNTAECTGTTGVDDDGNGYIDDCYGIDTYNNDTDPMDDNDHGTHVAGTIGAIGNNSVGVVGVNWNVTLMACKFLGASGSGSTSDAIACLDYVALMKERGVNIIATSNSWGGGSFSQALSDAIETQRQRGILFIAAAGNDNSDNDVSPAYPASYYLPNIISVASTTRTDARSSFSNYGRRTVHIGAPGSDILSTVINGYGTKSGTSMATPHVTGLAALLKAQNSSRDWKAIKNLVLSGGDNISSLQGKTVTEKRINAYGSLTCSNSTVLSRLRPIGSTTTAEVGSSLNLSALHINCSNPNGDVNVTVSPGGEIITLLDNGSSPDQVAGDGIYSGQWTPPSTDTYNLTFPSGDVVTVFVLQDYNYSSTTFNWRSISGTNLSLGDDQEAQITTPFSISFGGGSYGTMYVGMNGGISFTESNIGYVNSQIPSSSYSTLVAPFWDDLYPGDTEENVFWDVVGTSPNREMVIEWRNVRHYSCRSDSNATIRFQAVFFENSSDILFNYMDTEFGGNCSYADRGGSATVGVQVGQNEGTQYSYNTQTLNDNSTLRWFIPPTVIIHSPQNTTYTTTSIALNVSADGVISTWLYSLNGATNVTFTPNSTINASEGANTIVVWANDTAGNWGSATQYFTVDTTPPTITIHLPVNTTTRDNTPLLNVTFGEIVNYTWYNVNDTSNSTPVANTSNLTVELSVLPEGQHNITVYANDTLGNLNSSMVWFTIRYPIHNNNSGLNYTTIQDAIDSATENDTILVDAGTYNENVDINKSVNLIGAGADVTIINASNSNDHIFNVTANGVNISGFTVTGATIYPYAGIYLNGVNYSKITNNNASNNTYGIYLASSSTSNTIYHNNFINNTQQAYDDGNNTWDDGYPSGGNYWSDWTSPDANGDGVVDSPYNVSGGNNTDRYPITVQNGWLNIVEDTTPPFITIISPENTTYDSTSIALNYSLSSDLISSTFYSINNTVNVTLSGNTTINVSGDGQHNLTIYSNDTFGNINSSTVWFKVDTVYPKVTNLTATPSSPAKGSLTNITANVSDLNPDTVLLNITYPNSTIITETMSPGSNYHLYDFNASEYGTYEARVIANDTAGNVNDTVNISFYAVNSYTNTSNVTNGSTVVAINRSDLIIEVTANETKNATIGIEAKLLPSSASFALVGEINSSSTDADQAVKYLNVTNTTDLSNLSRIKIKIYYTGSEVSGLDNDTLAIYYWNGTNWFKCSDYIGSTIPNGPHVYDADRDTTNQYVWAEINHLSVYGLAGDIYVAPTPSTTITSGGGGGGGAPPPLSLLPMGAHELNSSTYLDILITLSAGGKINKERFVRVEDAVVASLLLIGRSPVPTDTLAATFPTAIESITGDRVEIAAEAAKDIRFRVGTYEKKLMVARDDLSVDSMAAVAYAKVRNIPLLLVHPDELPAVAEEAMDWILEYRPRDIIIVGGPKAVSKEVEAKLATKGNVVRIYGETRMETALALAKDLHEQEYKYRVIVITDYEKPQIDAALMAYVFDAPLLYVKSTELSPDVKDFIIEHKETTYGPTKVVLMGVDPKVASEINEILE